jgi:hypothetical protein
MKSEGIREEASKPVVAVFDGFSFVCRERSRISGPRIQSDEKSALTGSPPGVRMGKLVFEIAHVESRHQVVLHQCKVVSTQHDRGL